MADDEKAPPEKAPPPAAPAAAPAAAAKPPPAAATTGDGPKGKEEPRGGERESSSSNNAKAGGDAPPQDLSFLEKGGFEIIRIRERHGQFRKAVPTMPLPLAVVCLVLDVVLPGTGTLVSAFTVFKYPTEYEQKSEAFVNNVIAAFLQILTLVVLVGYIWSILWGVTFVSLAIGKKNADEKEAGLPEPTKV